VDRANNAAVQFWNYHEGKLNSNAQNSKRQKCLKATSLNTIKITQKTTKINSERSVEQAETHVIIRFLSWFFFLLFLRSTGWCRR
jgi:hypothetical protein